MYKLVIFAQKSNLFIAISMQQDPLFSNLQTTPNVLKRKFDMTIVMQASNNIRFSNQTGIRNEITC